MTVQMTSSHNGRQSTQRLDRGLGSGIVALLHLLLLLRPLLLLRLLLLLLLLLCKRVQFLRNCEKFTVSSIKLTLECVKTLFYEVNLSIKWNLQLCKFGLFLTWLFHRIGINHQQGHFFPQSSGLHVQFNQMLICLAAFPLHQISYNYTACHWFSNLAKVCK